MLGHVTSWCFSPNLDAWIALALVADGRARHGETLWAVSPLADARVAGHASDRPASSIRTGSGFVSDRLHGRRGAIVHAWNVQGDPSRGEFIDEVVAPTPSLRCPCSPNTTTRGDRCDRVLARPALVADRCRGPRAAADRLHRETRMRSTRPAARCSMCPQAASLTESSGRTRQRSLPAAARSTCTARVSRWRLRSERVRPRQRTVLQIRRCADVPGHGRAQLCARCRQGAGRSRGAIPGTKPVKESGSPRMISFAAQANIAISRCSFKAFESWICRGYSRVRFARCSSPTWAPRSSRSRMP